jgi:hypothetical protein
MRALAAAGLLLSLVACGGGAGPSGSPAASADGSTPDAGGPAVLAEAASPSLPLKLRVTGVRRIAGDVVRIELRLVNAATPGAAGPGTPTALALAAAVKALDGLSALSPDGRRRVFALRTPDGERVGAAPELPPPGESRGFWAAFPLAAGPIRLAAPGFPILAGPQVLAPAAPREPEP